MHLPETLYLPGVRPAGELTLQYCGWQSCAPGHAYGPAVRDHFLVHVVLDGRGTFRRGGAETRLARGDLFLIRPGEVTWYGADREDPWTYAWVGFDGSRAASLLARAGLAEAAVLRTARTDLLWRCIRDMRESGRGAACEEVAVLAPLYRFLSCLVEERGAAAPAPRALSEAYAERAVRFLEGAYALPITVGAVAAHLGIDRTHLFRVFRRHAGVSPQEYLVAYRLRKADELLLGTSLGIGEVALSVGFDSPAHFSALFHRRRGVSPREFRRRGGAGEG